MIRSLTNKKGGNMDKATQGAIDKFKAIVFKDYEAFQYGMWRKDIKEKPQLNDHYNKLSADAVTKFKNGFSMSETKYYYKFISDGGVHSFIVKEDKEIRRKAWKKGDILKPAGFNTPALNKPRGNIFGNYKVRWTGPLYLRGFNF
jgi:hypothetical protein